ELAARALNALIREYRHLGIAHKCRLVFVTAYLSDEQMLDLARGSTYYLNTSHAEGACLPLQDFLAAGRPGVAPNHTALADYFTDAVGSVVPPPPEPTFWPHDPDQRCTTTWHRLVWQALHYQLRASYTVAKQYEGQYRRLANRGRSRMTEFASAAQVWPRLAAALNLVGVSERHRVAAVPRTFLSGPRQAPEGGDKGHHAGDGRRTGRGAAVRRGEPALAAPPDRHGPVRRPAAGGARPPDARAPGDEHPGPRRPQQGPIDRPAQRPGNPPAARRPA